MRLISVNTGKPRLYHYKGRNVFTSIVKSPVKGLCRVNELNVEGDEQSDLTVHGGALKAVYSYDVSYYDMWKKILKRDDWGYGLFGENLTTEGLSDDTIRVGNIYEIGSVYLQAIQPRFPCFKISIRFGTEYVLKNFVKTGKHGTYFRVLQSGSLQEGDSISLVETSKHNVTIQQLAEAFYNKGANKAMVENILNIAYLPEYLRRNFENF